MFVSVCPKHAIVRGELDQLLTWEAGNGVLVQISIKRINRIFNVLTNVMLNFVRLTVVVIIVVVKKQTVLNILSVCL